jgi:GT2 family glycosyltransferase
VSDISSPARVAVIIVNYRCDAFTVACLAALSSERDHVAGLTAIVVDGDSGDGSAERLAAVIAGPAYCKWVSLMALDFNGGFGWANNQAMLRLLQSEYPPDYIYLLNPDTVVEAGCVAHLIDVMTRQPHAGAVGSRLLNADGQPSGAAFRFPIVAREFARGLGTPKLAHALGITPLLLIPELACCVDWVTGASVMLRSAALREIGLFDDGFFLYFEEVELMHRMRAAGWEVWHEPASRVMHIGGVATGVSDGRTVAKRPYPAYWFRSRRRFFGLAHGASGAFWAGIAWCAGRLLWQVRQRFQSSIRADAMPGEGTGMLGHGIRATPDDVTPAITRWADPAGVRPAWTRWS